MIRQKFWESDHPEDPWARLLFIAMWNYADDYGVGAAQLKGINGFAFPGDDISEARLEQMLRDIHQVYKVVFYKVKGKPYYQIPSWLVHQYVQHPSKTRYPTMEQAESWLYMDSFAMPDDPHEMFMSKSCDSHDVSQVKTRELEDKEKEKSISVRERPPATAKGSRIADDFMPSPGVVEAIKAQLGVDDSFLTYHHEKFCDFWRGKSGANGTKVDWDATWRNWMKTEVERNGNVLRLGGRSGQSAKVAGWAALGDD